MDFCQVVGVICSCGRSCVTKWWVLYDQVVNLCGQMVVEVSLGCEYYVDRF